MTTKPTGHTNCFAGIACPSCGQQGCFLITATLTARLVDDDGDAWAFKHSDGYNWDDTSPIRCHACHHSGTVADFIRHTPRRTQPSPGATLPDRLPEHTFTVTVHAATRQQAEQVMAERLYHDEDYGFAYAIGRAVPAATSQSDASGGPSEADPPEWLCSFCGGPNDDGNGYDGFCGGCADLIDDHMGGNHQQQSQCPLCHGVTLSWV